MNLESLLGRALSHSCRHWYSPLLPLETQFPSGCRDTLVSFLTSVSLHLARKRPVDTFLDFLTNSSSIVIVFLSELSTALSAARATDSSSADALYRYLEESPDSSLATVLDVEQQDRKLQVVAEDILHKFLDAKAYTFDPVRTFLREVLTTLILKATISTCSKPEFLNKWIIYLLEDVPQILADGEGCGKENLNGENVDGVRSTTKSTMGKGASSSTPLSPTQNSENHRRTVSRAESAMEEAMQEAKRLTELIVADEEKRKSQDQTDSSTSLSTHELTPTSSQSDLANTGLTAGQPTFEQSNTTESADPPENSNSLVFTTFDQMLPSLQPSVLRETPSSTPPPPPPLTLHKASVSIFDDSMPGEKGTLKSKPTVDYLLQIEPASSQYPGWMIPRKYTDFEVLHDTLVKIAIVSGVPEFSRKYEKIPVWKGQTKAALRSALEVYFREALSHNRLAESDAMKRFLDKEQGQGKGASGGAKGLAFAAPAAFETMGKGVLDVFASAPKGIAGGGKAVLGGVTGVFGGGQRKKPQSRVSQNGSAQQSRASLARNDSGRIDAQLSSMDRPSQDLSRSTNSYAEPSMNTSSTTSLDIPPSERSDQTDRDNQESPIRPRKFTDLYAQAKNAEVKDLTEASVTSDPSEDAMNIHLPPPPSEMPDNYGLNPNVADSPLKHETSKQGLTPTEQPASSLNGQARKPSDSSLAHPAPKPNPISSHPNADPSSLPSSSSSSSTPSYPPLTAQETTLTIELFFLLITQLYTLSSAWSLRRTLLTAAKNFLLRPANPQLEALRIMIQDTVIDANCSPVGIAGHIDTLRKNVLPTAEELEAWEKSNTAATAAAKGGELSADEKEALRVKARKLLVEKGMPVALTGVMGSAATAEAVGKVFDCLQVEDVARGLVFAVGVQVLRAIVV